MLVIPPCQKNNVYEHCLKHEKYKLGFQRVLYCSRVPSQWIRLPILILLQNNSFLRDTYNCSKTVVYVQTQAPHSLYVSKSIINLDLFSHKGPTYRATPCLSVCPAGLSSCFSFSANHPLWGTTDRNIREKSYDKCYVVMFCRNGWESNHRHSLLSF